MVEKGETIQFGGYPFKYHSRQNAINVPQAGKTCVFSVSIFGCDMYNSSVAFPDATADVEYISSEKRGSEFLITVNILPNTTGAIKSFEIPVTVNLGQNNLMLQIVLSKVTQTPRNSNSVTVTPTNYTLNFGLNGSLFEGTITVKQNNSFSPILIDLLGGEISGFPNIRSAFNTGRWILANDINAGLGGTFTVPGKWAYKICNVAVSVELKPDIGFATFTIYGKAELIANLDDINPHPTYPVPVTPVSAQIAFVGTGADTWGFAPVINFN
jgi:hypothetical protein